MNWILNTSRSGFDPGCVALSNKSSIVFAVISSGLMLATLATCAPPCGSSMFSICSAPVTLLILNALAPNSLYTRFLSSSAI